MIRNHNRSKKEITITENYFPLKSSFSESDFRCVLACKYVNTELYVERERENE